MTTRNLKNFNANQIGVWAGVNPVLEAGSLSWDSANGLRLHDGVTPGGNLVSSGGVGGPISQLTSGTASVTLNGNPYGGGTNILNISSATYLSFNGSGDGNPNEFFAIGLLPGGLENANTSSFIYSANQPFNITLVTQPLNSPPLAANTWTYNVDGTITLPLSNSVSTSTIVTSLGEGPDANWNDGDGQPWAIRNYTGGITLTYTTGTNQYGTGGLIWFDPFNNTVQTLPPAPAGMLIKGFILDYHLITKWASNSIYGDFETGTIHNVLGTMTHTKATQPWGNNDVFTVVASDTNGVLSFSHTQDCELKIMWTAKVFYHYNENYC